MKKQAKRSFWNGRTSPGDPARPHETRIQCEANVGKPQVSYKETITVPSTAQTKFVKQSGGRGQYAHVELEIEPNEKGKGNEVISKIVGGVIPREYIPAVIKGIEEGLGDRRFSWL